MRGGVVVAMLVLGVGGCGAEKPVALCPVTRLGISAGMDGVRVTNQSGAACRFAGRFPVSMAVQLVGDGPPAAKGTLPASGTYVQPYVVGASAACPAPDSRVRHSIPASVEGVAVAAVTQGTDAHFMVSCETFSVGAPRIEG